jgi:hypothetical protein
VTWGEKVSGTKHLHGVRPSSKFIRQDVQHSIAVVFAEDLIEECLDRRETDGVLSLHHHSGRHPPPPIRMIMTIAVALAMFRKVLNSGAGHGTAAGEKIERSSLPAHISKHFLVVLKRFVLLV